MPDMPQQGRKNTQQGSQHGISMVLGLEEQDMEADSHEA